ILLQDKDIANAISQFREYGVKAPIMVINKIDLRSDCEIPINFTNDIFALEHVFINPQTTSRDVKIFLDLWGSDALPTQKQVLLNDAVLLIRQAQRLVEDNYRYNNLREALSGGHNFTLVSGDIEFQSSINLPVKRLSVVGYGNGGNYLMTEFSPVEVPSHLLFQD
ncbi:MAG: hypothetical protein K8S56_01470, partial [Candidatus Cloacimonetes bacterium]|nr:hypothetical protein [Candidatus Cloacimonadota bacterium]